MDDRGVARWIASVFGRACKEPNDDPGLDPALDSATEIIAHIRAGARAEAAGKLPALSVVNVNGVRVVNLESALAAILTDEPKESAQCLTCGKQCPNGCPMDEPKEERGAEEHDTPILEQSAKGL